MLDHAHNIAFHILAEGGILLVTLSFWVIIRAARIWWTAWIHAPQIVRRRLEGILAAVLAFSVHNMVDAFLQTQFVVPVLIFLSYTVAHDVAPSHAKALRRYPISALHVRFGLAATLLVCGQLAFIPILRGAAKQQQFLALVDQDRLLEALDKVQEAQDTDPWLDLYVLEEATVLGELAAAEPDIYLADAIRTFEDSLDRNAIWDAGWHNLAALYAQTGDYQRAIDTEQEARRIRPLQVDYLLALGDYHARAGALDNAGTLYLEALENYPWLAASDFWRDPAYPERLIFLNDAIDHYADTATGIDLLVYSGAYERIPTHIDGASAAIERRLRALWPDGRGIPCLYCYYVLDNVPLLEAEILLHTEQLTSDTVERIETLARKAIFIDEPKGRWGWYILVRLAEHVSLTDEQIEHHLSRATALPGDSRPKFTGIYRVHGRLEILPQARFPMMSPVAYEPWLQLAAWQIAQGNLDAAYERLDMVRKIDPYMLNLAAQIADLPLKGTLPD